MVFQGVCLFVTVNQLQTLKYTALKFISGKIICFCLQPAFKFEIQPENKNPTGTDDEGVRGGFSIVRDAQELKRLVWRLLDSNPKSRPAMNLLSRLSELDDQVVNCAQPSPPSAMLLNSVTMGLVDLIQSHALVR